MRSHPTQRSDVKYSDIVKWELRNKDRRFACNPRNIFFKWQKHTIQQVQHRVFHKARRAKLQEAGATVGECKSNPKLRQGLVDGSIGHKEFAKLKGSAAFWNGAKSEAFANIRQLGAPAWFITCSCAEFNWTELMCCLQELAYGEPCSPEQASTLDSNKRYTLIKNDPVTCARHFVHRWGAFKKLLLQKCPEVLGGAIEMFVRHEFQFRGSPHVHALAWVKGAPSYDPEDPINRR